MPRGFIAVLPDRDNYFLYGLMPEQRGVLRGLATREGNKRGKIDEAGCVVCGSERRRKIRARR